MKPYRTRRNPGCARARLYDESSYESLLSINVNVVGPAFHISVNFFKRMLDRRETDRRLSKTWDSILDSILDNWDAALDLPEEERKEYLDALLGIGAVSETEQVRLRLKDLVAWKRDISFISNAWPPLGSSARTWSSGSTRHPRGR